MIKNYVKAYPKYKQEAFNKISNVILELLNEVDFFKVHPWLKDEPRIVLSYNEEDFKRRGVQEGVVGGFFVSLGGRFLFSLRGKEVHSIRNLRKQLTDKEYSVIYENLKVLHRFVGESGTMIESKIGRIVKYDIAIHGSEFVGQFGDIYREKRRLAR